MCILVVTQTHTTVVWGFVLFSSFYGESQGWNLACQASYLLNPLMSQAFLEYVSQALSCKPVYVIDCLRGQNMI